MIAWIQGSVFVQIIFLLAAIVGLGSPVAALLWILARFFYRMDQKLDTVVKTHLEVMAVLKDCVGARINNERIG